MVSVDAEKCNGCGACVAVCPTRAITLGAGKAGINYAVCKECSLCLEACCEGAIRESVRVPQAAATRVGFAANSRRKEVSDMPFGGGWLGRGRSGAGRGMGFGRGFGTGRGNPYPFCRFHPWLPRRWWAYGSGYTPALPPGTCSPRGYYDYGAPSARW